MARFRVDYHGKDLSDQKDRDFKKLAKELKLELFRADFSYANLQGVDFTGLSLREADFSYSHLKGADFSGADLRGAKFMHASAVNADANSSLGEVNFSNAKIQGTDFSNAILPNANFTGVRVGLSQDLHIKFVTLIALLASGFTAAIAISFFLHFFRNPSQNSSQKSTLPGQKPTLFSSLIVFLTAVFIIVGIRTIFYKLNDIIVLLHVLFGIFLIFLLLVFAVVMSDFEVDPSSLIIIAIIALLPLLALNKDRLIFGIIGAVIGSFLGCWFARLAICKNERFSWLNFGWLWRMYTKFASQKGTIFNSADLTGVDFTSASLKGASFEGAKITKACWHKAKYLDCAYVGRNNYLKYPGICYLLVVGEWKRQSNFDGLDLKGINLKGAKLKDTSFVGTDLSYADLRFTDLSYANLKKANLDNANLEGADLTGACIQSFSINEKTVFKGVTCGFVYLKDKDNTDPAKGIQERLPDAADDDFGSGDFETLFSKDSATLQLLVRNSDSRLALTAAFQELVQDRDTHYTFQGFEVIGKNALVKIRVSQGTNKAAVKSKFYQTLKQSVRTVQRDADFQGNENQSLGEFIPKLMLALEEIKEKVTNGSVNVGTYNVFQQVTTQRFIQGDSMSADNNSQTL